MIALQGIGTCAGIADGPLFLYQPATSAPSGAAMSPENEARAADNALEQARATLTALREEALGNGVSQDDASIFDIQAMMLADDDFVATIHEAILTQNLTAHAAILAAGESFAAQLRALDDPFMRERADDVLDACQRAVQTIAPPAQNPLDTCKGPVILAADVLYPSEVIQLDRNKIGAFITRAGGPSSHASILARSLGIPTITGLGDDFALLERGVRTMIDGDTGIIVQDPDTKAISVFAQKMLQMVKNERTLQNLKGLPATTQNGIHVMLTANIALVEEAKKALACGAEGIGLFRSELLYYENDGFPSENALYEAYCEVLQVMDGRRVVVRTPDMSVERELQGETAADALPGRALPLHQTQPEQFMAQLRAVLRASAYGPIDLLLPMVITVEEVRAARAMLNTAREEVQQQYGVPQTTDVRLGIMVETPAATMMMDLLAQEVDFVSIGTNDLTQYTLATARVQRPSTEGLNAKHPAVMRMIEQVVRSAREAGIPACICGECAADPSLAGFFAGIGVAELSMAPSSILKMKRAIRALSLEDCMAAVASALQIPLPPQEEME